MKLSPTIEIGPPAVLWSWLAGILLIPALYFVAFFTGWIEHTAFRPILRIVSVLSPGICLAAICMLKGVPVRFKLILIVGTGIAICVLMLATIFTLGALTVSHNGLNGIQ